MHPYLIFIFIIALLFRLYGINWDQGFHLHPDERFITMVTNALQFSGNYFDTHQSLLNPHNVGYDFYVYGTWPLIFVKFVAGIFQMDNYDKLILVGRFFSAVFDSITAILICLVSLKIFKNKFAAVVSGLFYAFTVLPIQLSHFYAVDTFLVFFLTLSLLFLLNLTSTNLSPITLIKLGIAFGLAVSAKVSAILFLPIIVVYLVIVSLRASAKSSSFSKKSRSQLSQEIITSSILRLVIVFTVFFLSLLISIRVFYPYLFDGFLLNQKVLQNWSTLKTFDIPGYFPPGVQWLNFSVLDYYFNTLFFGLGLPIGLLFVLSLLNIRQTILKYPVSGILFLWIFGLCLYQGFQYAKPFRYLFPVYPAITIIIGISVANLKNLQKTLKPRPSALGLFIGLAVILWTFGFMSIYQHSHTRVQASDWILKNIPKNSKISCEYWDDCLPLMGYENYQTLQLTPYDLPDSEQKISKLKSQLSEADYIIFTSNRLFAGIPSSPQLYPLTTKLYQEIFTENSGFKKIAEFSSRPNLFLSGIKICLTPPYFNYGFVSKPNQWCNQTGISLVDDYAEESFTVYDHPKIIIFKNILK